MPSSRTPRQLLEFILLAASVSLFAQTSPGPAQDSKYVGAEVCESCHEDEYKSFAASAHLATLRKKSPAEQGCEACHGPGADHVAAGDPDKIRRFSTASALTIQDACTACHAASLSEAHTKARLTCLTCHSAHHYQQVKSILVVPQAQLCRRCHHQ
jgi:predicted CXXCH cytochrome family protein